MLRLKIIRFKQKNEKPQLAVVLEDEKVYPLQDGSFQMVMEKAAEENMTCSEYVMETIRGVAPIDQQLSQLALLAPLIPEETWAAGVTYLKSKEARNREAKIEKDSYYDKVYDAKRPEIFLKSTARRIVGPDEPVGIRTDSNWQIPEPELALVIREDGEIVGYTIGNDMSSRDIEGENPLYLPQAKMWKNSCSIGPAILLADTVTDPYDLNIECRIKRDGQCVFKGSENTSMLKIRYEELVDFLLHDNDIVSGTTLLTGTCIVPDDSFTLEEGDEIEIEIDQIGILRNPVKMANHIE